MSRSSQRALRQLPYLADRAIPAARPPHTRSADTRAARERLLHLRLEQAVRLWRDAGSEEETDMSLRRMHDLVCRLDAIRIRG